MQIGNNTAAFNTWKNYTGNVDKLRTSMSKLSSGSRITNAGDDPSGLAMSERLRTQSRNTAAAASNVENKLNYLQTADSWMQKMHDMLGRMGELAVMANDGTKSETDKAVLQNEFSQMQQEIERITGDTSEDVTGADINAAGKFNGIELFQGGTAISQQVGADGGQVFTSASALDLSGESTASIGSVAATTWGAMITSDAGDSALDATAAASTTAAAATLATLTAATATSTAAIASDTEVDDAITAGAGTDTLTTAIAAANTAGDTDREAALQALVDDAGNGLTGTSTLTESKVVTLAAEGAAATAATTADTANTTAQALATSDQAAADAAATTATIRIDSTANAAAAVTEVNAAIDFISEKRSQSGAEMKRMEQTLDGLRSYEENISATESRIRDVDVAKETTEMSKYSILQQVGTAMLAQANQMPQGVLQLLG